MNLPRTQVVDSLFDFCCAGSGLLVGDPGIGKTWTLKAVRDKAKRENIPCVCIGIDTVHAENEEQLLPYLKEDLIDYLRKIPVQPAGRALLLFDAFDAARSDAKRNLFLRLIQRSLHDLSPSWTVCVSVRTFDAQKSLDLAKMFASGTDATRRPRQTTIPPLSQEDIAEALQVDAVLQSAYEHAPQQLKEILTNPFNLWLLEQVSHSGEIIDFSDLRTASELLNLFWFHRVKTGAGREKREHLLRKIAEEQVNSRQLLSRKALLYDAALDDAWQQLFSAKVLVEDDESNGEVRFTHNILFDYAVAKLLIPGKATELEAFLKSDPTRHLFLRPSLIYHFEGQFHNRRPLFWQNYFESCKTENAILAPLTRLIFPTVLVAEASQLNDFSPLLESLHRSEPVAFDGIVNLLRAMRALTADWAILDDSKVRLWASLLKDISQDLDDRFAWDVGIINDKLIQHSKKTPKVQSLCGSIARSLFSYAWKIQDPIEEWNYRLASVWGIPQTCLTFATSPEESRTLLTKVLDLIEIPQFPIDCISALCTNIENIISADPSFVGAIYERVFSYRELSMEKTQMGGRVMPMISDRRQDYSMCEYHLYEHYHNFVFRAPLTAIESGIRSLSHWILRSHVEPYLNPGVTIESLREPFMFRGQAAIYIQDLSHIWDRGAYPDQELRIADDIEGHLEDLSNRRLLEQLESILLCYGKNSQLAFFWSRLLGLGSRHPELFADYLYDLCIAYPILLGADTTDAVASFIAKAFPFWKDKQKEDVEMAIVGITQQALDVEEPEQVLPRIQRRLLRSIPVSHLTTDLARALFREEAPPPPEPCETDPGTSVGWQKVTLDESLEIRGVETAAPENRDILNVVHKIEEILQANQNAEIDGSTVDELVILSKDLESLVANLQGTHPAVRLQADTQIAAIAHKMLCYCNSLTGEQLEFATKRLLKASKAKEPRPNPEADAKWDHPYWSPLPRTEAAQGIVALTSKVPDNPDVIASLRDLAADEVAAIRFLTICNLSLISASHRDLFIDILRSRIALERHPVVLDGLCRPLYHALNFEEIRALVKILVEQIDPEHALDYQSDLVSMLVDMRLREIEEWPASYLSAWTSEPDKFYNLLYSVARRLFDYVRQARMDGLTISALAQLNEIVVACITFFLRQIDKPQTEVPGAKTRTLYKILDDTIMQLRVTLDSDIRHRRKEQELSEIQVRNFFPLLRPILDNIAIFGANPRVGLHASTAHRFMELLHSMVSLFPEDVLSLAGKVVEAGKGGGYQFDSLGMKEIVEVVEALLADHREVLRKESSLRELLSILDTFASAGWPEALRLVWRLDEVYR